MSVYFVASFDVVDPETYQGYLAGVFPLLMKHGAEIVVADYDPKPIEGQSRNASVVLKFESEEACMNWYNDPEYQPVMQIRLKTTENGIATLAKEFVMEPA